MRYLCTHCNYIYDESRWDPEQFIEPGQDIYAADYFVCPGCWESVDYFQEIVEEVNYVAENTKDNMEMDHMPIIDIQNGMLTLSIWKNTEHPMWLEHYISSIGIYDEYGDRVIEDFLWPDDEIEREFDVSDLDEFEIRIRCTLHWVWWMKVKQ